VCVCVCVCVNHRLLGGKAMAMELAVVGADVGGQRELIPSDCECGILVSRDGGYPTEVRNEKCFILVLMLPVSVSVSISISI
jgi:hypothetical protein